MRHPHHHDHDRPRRWPSRSAWALLAVLAGVGLLMGIPEREMTPEEAAAARHVHAVEVALGELRAAVAEYRADHGAWPGIEPGEEGSGRGSEAWLQRHLTMASDLEGTVAPGLEERFPYGPYLAYGIPENPANGLSDVRVLAPGERLEDAADGSTGWIYDPISGAVRPNVPGETPEAGLRYLDL